MRSEGHNWGVGIAWKNSWFKDTYAAKMPG